MTDEEETQTEEAEQTEATSEDATEATAGDDATEAQGSEGAAEDQTSEGEAAAVSPTPEPARDPAVAAAIEHLEGVDLEQDREAVDELSKDLAP